MQLQWCYLRLARVPVLVCTAAILPGAAKVTLACPTLPCTTLSRVVVHPCCAGVCAAVATTAAGILGSRGDGRGIVGMFPNVPVYCLKVLGATGQGTMGTVVTALTWVANNGRRKGIRVVNLSLSGETNMEVCDAITAVTQQGITVVVAAGNNGQDMSNFSPANCPDALVVTAMSDLDGKPGGQRGTDPATGERDDTAARYSNYATKGKLGNMIAAPGE